MENNRDKFNLSLRMDVISGDLRQKFTNQIDFPKRDAVQEEEYDEKDEEIELSLGLSMNGRFGVDPSRKRLRRSSSISNLVFSVNTMDGGNNLLARDIAYDNHAPPLVRTCSLPIETEEEWRRRKQLKSMRRMEARKKRMEKLKQVKMTARDKDTVTSFDGSNAAVEGGANCPKPDDVIRAGLENGNLMTSSQRAGGSSCNVSDLQHQQLAGCGKKHTNTTKRSLISRLSRDEVNRTPNGPNDLLKTTFLDMPYVSTRGDGPNGHKIEGFLYRYKKREEVRIVCVCHGLFLSPAEFVKHGGGGDVERPLEHIVVVPSRLLSF